MCFFEMLVELFRRLTRPSSGYRPIPLKSSILGELPGPSSVHRPIPLESSIPGELPGPSSVHIPIPLESSIPGELPGPSSVHIPIPLESSIPGELPGPSSVHIPIPLESSILGELPGPSSVHIPIPLESSIHGELPGPSSVHIPIPLESSILGELPGPSSVHRPIPLESSMLGKLSPDIIIYLARFLPNASAASFALCCGSISEILGTRYWEALQAEDQQLELEAFLSLLERELPDYILCYYCTILHTGNKARYEARTQPPTRWHCPYGAMPCYTEELLGGVFQYIHSDFRFTVFQKTMKRYRLGLDYSYHLNLLACNNTCHRSIKYFPFRCTAQARIIAGSLLLRVQEVVLIPSGQALKNVQFCLINICPHVGIVAEDPRAQLPENVPCEIVHQHDLKQCIRYSGLKQCNVCPTEYRIDLQECGQHGVAVVTTKWLDLGEGRTILDPKWWSHLSRWYTDHGIFARADGIYKEKLINRAPVPFEAGSIHASFDLLLTPEKLNELSQMLN